MLTKEQVIKWATRHGYHLDKYGHLQKVVTTDEGVREYRLKLQDNSVRHEAKLHHDATQYSPKTSEWIRLTSAYLKHMHITEDDKLSFIKEEKHGK